MSEETKIYSIEIELTQGLTLEDYKELADDIESAVHQCNYPVDITDGDEVVTQEDVIVGVHLMEKTEIAVNLDDEGEEE